MRDAILIADNMEVNRAMLAQLFSNDYDIVEAENGEEVLALLAREDLSIALVLLDVSMPIMDGYEVLQAMGRRGVLQRFPVVVLTSEESAGSAVLPFDLGAVDIIARPFEPYIVKRRMRNIIDLYHHKNSLESIVADQAKNLQISNESMLDALSSVIEYRSMESGQHIRRIRMFTKILLEHVAEAFPGYNLDERKINIIASASSMHDIGKIAIPDSILNKPGRLTPEEFEIMKSHAVQGSEIIRSIGWMENREYLEYAYLICRYHHERWDGRGYPDGIQGDNIPVCAQIVGVADAYDALTTRRVYKDAYSHEEAFRMILAGECGHFSPRLLECFKSVHEAFRNLSLAYRDGQSPREERFQVAPQIEAGLDPGSTQYGQLKYFTALKFLNATVLELDLDSVTLHTAYKASPAFHMLSGNHALDKAFSRLINEVIYPEDRDYMINCLSGSLQELLERGESGHFWEFRIWDPVSDAFCWHLATVLKIDTESPRLHRALLIFEDIHASKTAALQHSADERQYHSALCSIYAASFSVDVACNAYTLISSSDSRFKWDGLPSSYRESVQYLAREMVHPADRDAFLKTLSSESLLALLPGQTFSLEYRHLDSTSVYRWVDLSLVRSDDPGSDHSLIFVFIRDIEDQKQMEWKTIRAEVRLKTALQDYFSVVMELNLTTHHYALIKLGKRTEGLPESGPLSLLKALAQQTVHPDDLDSIVGLFHNDFLKNAFIAGAGRIAQQYRALCDNGEQQWYEVVLTRETSSPSGDLLVLLFLQRVFRPTVSAETLPALPSTLPSDLLTLAPGGLARIALDDEFTVLEATDGFFRLFGYTREEFYAAPLDGRGLRLIKTSGDHQLIAVMRDKLVRDATVRMELSVLHRDGSDVRIHCTLHTLRQEDGSLVALGVFAAESVDRILDPLTEEQNYLSLIRQFQDILFEYDLTTQTIRYSDNFLHKFGVDPPTTFDQIVTMSSKNIHEDDLPGFMETLSSLAQLDDRSYWESEYRYRTISGDYIWCWERTFVVRELDNQPHKVVGIISDVGRYKLQNELLEARANTDQLTGLYNKSTAERLIRSVLADGALEERHALFVVDIDDFKLVNDSSGHLMGDEVLRKIAHRILAQFRRNDIVGRIGGDEFVVLLRDVPDQSLITKKATSLLQELQELFADIDQRRYISASVGIAIYPQDGQNYQELFERADTALYAAKRSGKEQWRMFSPQLQSLHGSLLSPPRTNRIEGTSVTGSVGFIAQAMQLLFEIDDEEEAVRAVLDLAARRYSLNHIYVYELDGEVRRLFDWNANSAVRYHRSSSPAELCRIVSELHIDGSPYICNQFYDNELDHHLLPLFKELDCGAVLQAPIFDRGNLFGVAGFSEKNGPRQWSSDEVNACRFLARTVSLLYVYKRAQERLGLAESVNTLLINQIGFAGMVVDESYFIKHSCNALDNRFGSCVGSKCYVLLQHRNAPCPDCPIYGLSKSTTTVCSTCHVHMLDASFHVQATRVRWGHQHHAYLIMMRELSPAPLPANCHSEFPGSDLH